MIEVVLLVYVRHGLITIFKCVIIMLHASRISQALWVVDSGVTHHIASDTQSLDTMQDYHNSEDIVMGNGNNIPISHTGNVKTNASNHQFHLHHIGISFALSSGKRWRICGLGCRFNPHTMQSEAWYLSGEG